MRKAFRFTNSPNKTAKSKTLDFFLKIQGEDVDPYVNLTQGFVRIDDRVTPELAEKIERTYQEIENRAPVPVLAVAG